MALKAPTEQCTTLHKRPLEAPVRRQNVIGNSGIAWNTTNGPKGLERALKSIEENAYIGVGMGALDGV